MTTQTQEKTTPKQKEALLNAYKTAEEVKDLFLDPKSLKKSVLDRLPQPTGWRILVLPYGGVKKTKGGILLSDKTQETIQMTTVCAYVLKVGPLAYYDKEKFPTGPWCKKGDWVIFARYAGSRLPIEGGEVRLLNDDEVLGKIKDPESVLHNV